MPKFLKGFYVTDPDPPLAEKAKPRDNKGVFKTLIAEGKSVPVIKRPISTKVRYGKG